MTHPMRLLAARGAVSAAAALLATACSSPPPAPGTPIPGSVTGVTAPHPVTGPVPATPAVVALAPAAPAAQAGGLPAPSQAATAREYRRDAAAHLYAHNRQRIWSGRLPPMLYAIGVLDVHLDGRGNIRAFEWKRAPRHAPEVIAEIERTVRAAAPFPAPARMGRVTYTDVWLWHQSGRFQLDTLTEGQD